MTRTHFYGSRLFLLALSIGLITASAQAQVPLTQLSQDTFTDPASQHQSEVEPGTFSYGSTIVTAFQVARIYGGGGADIGFATSTNGGSTWTNGYLPGLTIYQGNGLSDAASDAAVAYDALHGVWLISVLPIGNNTSVAVSRSTDGINWSDPISVTTDGSPDKNWITCDSTPTSKYYGHCYSEWDDTDQGDLIEMSTSTDGGLTWSPEQHTAGDDYGIGGAPIVTPKGAVIVPINGFDDDVIAFTSTNGGKTWNRAVEVASDTSHEEGGELRSAGLISSAHRWQGQGVCRLVRLPVSHKLRRERHRLQHLHQRQEMDRCSARAHRPRLQHGGSFHHRHGHRSRDLWQKSSRRFGLLLLPATPTATPIANSMPGLSSRRHPAQPGVLR